MKIPPRSLALAISGIGLILFGLAALLLVPLTRWRDESLAVTNFSAIPAKVQYDAPALTLKDVQGVEHSLSDYRGQVVLVNLWARPRLDCSPRKAARLYWRRGASSGSRNLPRKFARPVGRRCLWPWT